MTIEFLCRSCAQKLRVADEQAGKRARCPQCGTIADVPNPLRLQDKSPDESPDESPDDGKPARDDVASQEAVADSPAIPVQAAKTWHLKMPDGSAYGPLTKDELDQWVAERRVPPEASILSESDSKWRAAIEYYPRLAAQAASAAPHAAPSQKPSPFADTFTESAAVNPYQASSVATGRPRGYATPSRGGTILALGIGSLACCPILGLAALVMGANDLSAMNTGRMDSSGRTLTIIGMVLGGLGTGALVLNVFGGVLGVFGN